MLDRNRRRERFYCTITFLVCLNTLVVSGGFQPLFGNVSAFQVILLATIALLLGCTIFEWVVFLSLRLQGLSREQPVFFPSGLPLYREAIFFASMVLLTLLQSAKQSTSILAVLRYLLRPFYFQRSIFIASESILPAFFLTEFLNSTLSDQQPWPNRRHMVISLAAGVVIAVLRIVALKTVNTSVLFEYV